MGGCALSGSSACLLQAARLASREVYRGRRYRAQTCDDHWHMLSNDADYMWAGPALLARKFRSVELRAGLPTSHARRRSALDYNSPPNVPKNNPE